MSFCLRQATAVSRSDVLWGRALDDLKEMEPEGGAGSRPCHNSDFDHMMDDLAALKPPPKHAASLGTKKHAQTAHSAEPGAPVEDPRADGSDDDLWEDLKQDIKEAKAQIYAVEKAASKAKHSESGSASSSGGASSSTSAPAVASGSASGSASAASSKGASGSASSSKGASAAAAKICSWKDRVRAMSDAELESYITLPWPSGQRD
eukprot:6948504-Pyramimonas_sp.AAC.1